MQYIYKLPNSWCKDVVEGINVIYPVKNDEESFNLKLHVKEPPTHNEIANLYINQQKTLHDWLSTKFGNTNIDIADVIQKTFIKLLELDDIKRINNLEAYIRTIALNYSLIELRNQSMNQNNSDRYFVEVFEEQDTISPEHIYFANKYFSETINKLSVNLSHKQQQIIVMYRIEGKSYKDINKQTGWSLSDICRQIKKADEFIVSECNYPKGKG